ncbi:MAG: universal stress protein [Burkholderiales bacterium]
MLNILIPVDGSDNSLRTVQYLIREAALYKTAPELHLLNVQHPFPGTIRGVHEQAEKHHHDEGIKALAGARKLLDESGVKYTYHIVVGEPGETIGHFVTDKKIDQVVMGTRGACAVAGMLMGSVATKVLHLVKVPVTLVI